MALYRVVVCNFILTSVAAVALQSCQADDVTRDDELSLLQSDVHLFSTSDEHNQLDGMALGLTQKTDLPSVICRDKSQAVHYATVFPQPANGCPKMSSEEAAAPLADMKMGANQDRACLLFPTCAAAHEGHNLAIYSRTWASSFAAVNGESINPSDYDDGVLKMPAGSWLGDAGYALQSGFFDIPHPQKLLQDKQAFQQKLKDICSAIPDDLKASVSYNEIITLWSKMNDGAAKQALLPAGHRRPFINATEAQIHNAAYCATGSMDCMLYWVLDYYCKMSDGRIGSGCQCQKDFTYGMPYYASE